MPPPFDPSEVDALFEAAIDESPPRRRALLEARCAGRPELLEEVWALLQIDARRPADFLENPPVALSPRDEALSPAARIGRFAVLSRVGEGGMGVVYAAYDGELDRRVALKLLAPGMVGPEGRARLRREAQAMAKLSHPNVVPIYEVGEHEGRVFVAMEFVEGQTLRAFCRDEVRAWEAVLAAGIQAGRGLAAAHEAGLIHRDVKPDNILIGDDGRARVVDFGLARRSDDGEPREPRSARPNDEGGPKSSTRAPLTRAGTLMGTPAYLAPEQVERAAATAKSDQFSFCVTLYEALYGELPFADAARRARLDPGPSKREGAPGDVLRPPPPGARVPAWVRSALARGLRERPEDRWPRLAELLDTLADKLEKGAYADLSVSRRERLRLALLLAVFIAALAFFVLGRFVPMTRPTHLFWAGGLATATILALLVRFRRPLSKNAANRRIGYLLGVMTGSTLLHRGLAVLTDEPVERALVTDLLVSAAVLSTAAVLMNRTVGLSAGLCAAGAVAAAVLPAHASGIYAAAMLGSVATMILVWRRG